MLNDIITFDQRANRYTQYMAQVQSQRFTTGMECIDEVIRGVAPGEVLTIIAYSGTFKTALLQNLLVDAAERSGMYQLFFSMEMPAEKVFEREMQISNQMMGRAVEHHFSAEEKHRSNMISMAKSRGCDKVLVVEKNRRSLEQVAEYVSIAEMEYGDVQAIGLDYMALMKASGKDLFARTEELSIGLKELAKATMKPVIVLSQVNRGYAQSTGKEIETDAAKGGGDIEAGADFMFGMYVDADGELILKILKNRNGVKDRQFKMLMDRSALRFIGAEEYTPKPTTTTKKPSF